MKKLLITCVTSTLLLTSSLAKADFWSDTEISANVAYGTDYLFYGASQTNGGPAVSGGFDLALPFGFGGGEFYLGTWASSVEQGVGPSGDAASLELDYYGGIAGDSLMGTGISWDVGGWFYTYPEQDADAGGNDFDYVEAYATFGYTFENVAFSPSISTGVYYSPDYFGSNNDSIYVPSSLELSLPMDFGLYFNLGYFDVDVPTGPDNYIHYSVGVTKSFLGLDHDLSWAGQDDDCGAVQGVNCGGIVWSTSKSF